MFDDIIDRQASPGEAARTAAVIASDFRFAYFGSAAFVVRLLRSTRSSPMACRCLAEKMSSILNVKPELLQEFCGHLAKPGDETVVLFADGRTVEIPVL